MKFGKLPNIEHVDFSLPLDAKGTTRLLDAIPDNGETPKVYVGATGWSMKEWVGKYYPQGTKTADYLKAYGKQFNTIELNTTHYRVPKIETIAKWKRDSPPDFKFCPKLTKWISHTNDLSFGSGRILEFCESVGQLEEKMGCCFMQLPPYFGFDRLKYLKQFLKQWPNHIPLAIEVRHESFFNNGYHFVEFFDLLEAYQIATVITDVAGRRDVLHQRLTKDIAFIRFVGNGLHQSDYNRLDEWITRLNKWFKQGLKTVYFFPHEPDNLLTPDIANYFVEKMKELSHVEIRGPRPVFHNNQGQISLF